MSTLAPEREDQELGEVEDLAIVELEESFGRDAECLVTYNYGPPCGRLARWRLIWKPFPCGHREGPSLVCDRHRKSLTKPPTRVACKVCHARWPAAEHVERVEAL